MARFVSSQEISRLISAPKDSIQKKLYNALRNRIYEKTKESGFVQPGDTQEWWHLCWERSSDAAFIWYIEKNPDLGKWIRQTAFWLRDQEAAEWIGPWFRNHNKPLTGQLETAHAALALCEILEFCADLFSVDEKKSLEDALKAKGMKPCLRYC